MITIDFFHKFLTQVLETPSWKQLEDTVEDSPWHREENVAIHTLMTINAYLQKFAAHRTEREQMYTLVALCFHDFGKPEAEETLEKKDQPGVFCRRYAGHELISSNEFMNFMCEHHDLREQFFAQGYGWEDVRRVKFMIEHHLPYGLKNPMKRANLRQAIALTMGEDEDAYWDMLRSDAAGRISDDHEQKLQSVEDFINEFQPIPFEKTKAFVHGDQKTLFMLMGVSGAGKSTWIKSLKGDFNIASEDNWRLEYTQQHLSEADRAIWNDLPRQDQYDVAWKFCHASEDKGYDAFAWASYQAILAEGKHIILDRMNPTRKGRGKWINPAKEKGYRIESVEFFISEEKAKARQATRGDKRIPDSRVHQIVMQLEVPWLGPEVDAFELIPQV